MISYGSPNDPNSFVLYRYVPSLPAAIIFVILFLTSTFLHIYQATKRRTYYFIPLIVGGFFEWVGYIGRAMGHFDKLTLSPFIMQELLLLLAPALFAASIYMILGRIILFTDGEKSSLIRSTWLTKIFVCGDVFSFLVQSAGGGLMANASSMASGKRLVVVGLLLQLFFFGFFVVTSRVFQYRITRSPTPAALASPWKKYIHALYAASILILIRSTFRVILFSLPNDSALNENEVFVYIFDGVLMLGVMVMFNVVHPGAIISGRKKAMVMREIPMERDDSYNGLVQELQK